MSTQLVGSLGPHGEFKFVILLRKLVGRVGIEPGHLSRSGKSKTAEAALEQALICTSPDPI
jgi:hypothetical protein